MSVATLARQQSSSAIDQPYQAAHMTQGPRHASKPSASLIASDVKHGDFRDDLFRDGVVVVPGVITEARAAEYVSRAHEWLESFNLGYKRDEPATWQQANLPSSVKGGLYFNNGICHSQLAWDVRQEPKVIEAFSKIWGTDELLVSFDGVNIGVPLDLSDEANKGLDKPWPHVDQSPIRPWLHAVQGIVNLAENGPLDGGLTVFRGSAEHFEELFKTFADREPAGGWSTDDWYTHDPDMLDWLKARGCYWEKLCAPPGSLILWDSRAVHYGAIPLSKTARVAAYVCYKPAKMASDDVYAIKQEAFAKLSGTSHDPISFRVRPIKPEAEGDAAWAKIKDNLPAPPELTAVGRKLAGLDRY